MEFLGEAEEGCHFGSKPRCGAPSGFVLLLPPSAKTNSLTLNDKTSRELGPHELTKLEFNAKLITASKHAMIWKASC